MPVNLLSLSISINIDSPKRKLEENIKLSRENLILIEIYLNMYLRPGPYPGPYLDLIWTFTSSYQYPFLKVNEGPEGPRSPINLLSWRAT